jgi:methionine synthase I (cobalamin-dependent)
VSTSKPHVDAVKPFPERLQEGVVVCDGAMGTMLYARGIFVNRCFDELNLSNPDLVRSVHQEYVEAGADVIETNTFGAHRMKLGPHGSRGSTARAHAWRARRRTAARWWRARWDRWASRLSPSAT